MRSRSTATELGRLLHGLTTPVCVFDEDRRLVFANHACALWTGVSLDELIGQTASYTSVSSSDNAAPVDRLCPPPEALVGQQQSGCVYAVSPDGELRCRRADFLPLDRTENGSASPVLVLIGAVDITADMHSLGASHRSASANDDAQLLHDRTVRFQHEQSNRCRLDRLIGDSPAMQLARWQVRAAIASGASATIVGPPGSGREHLARTIHYGTVYLARKHRPDQQSWPFLPLDGAILTGEVLASAVAAVSGHGRAAALTLLLLHLDRLPPEIQAELLRLSGQRLNGPRYLATSEVASDALLAQGRLHPQLAAIAGTLVIRLPPLVDRREDIPLLAQLAVEELNVRSQRQLRGFSAEAIDSLVAYSWPGNAAELQSIVAEAFAKAEGMEITVAELPRRLFHAAEAARRPARTDEPIVLEEFLQSVERELIERALAQAKGNKARAARLLGLTRPRLYRRMVQLGLEEAASVAAGASTRLRQRPTVVKRGPQKAEPRERVTEAAASTDHPDVARPTIDEEAEFIEDIPFEEQPE